MGTRFNEFGKLFLPIRGKEWAKNGLRTRVQSGYRFCVQDSLNRLGDAPRFTVFDTRPDGHAVQRIRQVISASVLNICRPIRRLANPMAPRMPMTAMDVGSGTDEIEAVEP
jgi:hypothetical protein